MAVAGRPPKLDGQKVNRVPLTQGWMEVSDVPYTGDKPALGRVPKKTREWWERVSTMPHCVLWTDADWQYALDTAAIHAMFIKTGWRGAGELRQRMQKMGCTLDDRRANRIRYVNPLAGLSVPEDEDDDDGGDTVGLADFEARRRRRLLEAVE